MTELEAHIADAIRAGRRVPKWIADRAQTVEEFEAFMSLREQAFPGSTEPSPRK
jgi:hypothetical protein